VVRDLSSFSSEHVLDAELENPWRACLNRDLTEIAAVEIDVLALPAPPSGGSELKTRQYYTPASSCADRSMRLGGVAPAAAVLFGPAWLAEGHEKADPRIAILTRVKLWQTRTLAGHIF